MNRVRSPEIVSTTQIVIRVTSVTWADVMTRPAMPMDATVLAVTIPHVMKGHAMPQGVTSPAATQRGKLSLASASASAFLCLP